MITDKSLLTQTLAEVYAEQGHLKSAAKIYLHLMETWPDRPEYKEAFEEISNHLAAEQTETDPALVGLITTWIELEVSCAKLKQFTALRINRKPEHEKTGHYVDFDIAQ